MEAITLKIPNMLSPESQLKVMKLVNKLDHAYVVSAEPGLAFIRFNFDYLLKDEIIEEIERAGYTVANKIFV